jgi:hypothetical protein
MTKIRKFYPSDCEFLLTNVADRSATKATEDIYTNVVGAQKVRLAIYVH